MKTITIAYHCLSTGWHMWVSDWCIASVTSDMNGYRTRKRWCEALLVRCHVGHVHSCTSCSILLRVWNPRYQSLFTNVFFISVLLYVANVTINVYYHSISAHVTLLWIMWSQRLPRSVYWTNDQQLQSQTATNRQTILTDGFTNVKLRRTDVWVVMMCNQIRSHQWLFSLHPPPHLVDSKHWTSEETETD